MEMNQEIWFGALHPQVSWLSSVFGFALSEGLPECQDGQNMPKLWPWLRTLDPF